jgi:hypothetical protein
MFLSKMTSNCLAVFDHFISCGPICNCLLLCVICLLKRIAIVLSGFTRSFHLLNDSNEIFIGYWICTIALLGFSSFVYKIVSSANRASFAIEFIGRSLV